MLMRRQELATSAEDIAGVIGKATAPVEGLTTAGTV